jgi:hypothetical protein
MNTVISGSVLDETLAAVLLRHRQSVLTPRRRLLAAALDELALWCERERRRIEWVRPEAGALCCLRLRSDVFDDAAVSRFWGLLPRHDLQLASGTWFGEIGCSGLALVICRPGVLDRRYTLFRSLWTPLPSDGGVRCRPGSRSSSRRRFDSDGTIHRFKAHAILPALLPPLAPQSGPGGKIIKHKQ